MSESVFFENPLVSRYASRAMAELFSETHRIGLWRRLWIALAEAQRELGLPISSDQINEMRAAAPSIDFERAREYERRFRHDVMAHIHAFGDLAPSARGIIHLGATSCYVTDNADLLMMREGLGLILAGLVRTLSQLADFARQHRDRATLGFTHFQAAQLTTVGKRATLWMQDLLLDIDEIERRRQGLRLRGVKGTTGTQASFLALFDGDHGKVKALERKIAETFDMPGSYPVTGQTYSRKVDSQIVDALSGVCQSAHKFGTDLRLLAHRKEIEEPFEAEQVGSSAMAYKRNPMRSERLCSLARFVMGLPAIAAQTESVQWFERTLDDSAARRLYLPQAFLGADAVLRLLVNVTSGLVVHPEVITRGVAAELPFMATENLIMAGVRAGGDRQALHEIIRRKSHEASARVKKEGADNDLIDRLKQEPEWSNVDLNAVLDPNQYIGRAPQQVDEFLSEEVEPVLERYRSLPAVDADIRV